MWIPAFQLRNPAAQCRSLRISHSCRTLGMHLGIVFRRAQIHLRIFAGTFSNAGRQIVNPHSIRARWLHIRRSLLRGIIRRCGFRWNIILGKTIVATQPGSILLGRRRRRGRGRRRVLLRPYHSTQSQQQTQPQPASHSVYFTANVAPASCRAVPKASRPSEPRAKTRPTSAETAALQKNTGRSGGGFERPVWRSPRGEDAQNYYIDEGLFCPVVAGAAVGCVVSPTVFVIRRTSTRRLSARPSRVLFDSTGLSLPRPIT